MDKMRYIVYRTENKVNGKFYYGVHTNDGSAKSKGYLGSGKLLKLAIKKYGRDNFVRRTIMEFDTQDEAYDFEEMIVDQFFVDRLDCYNMVIGGSGRIGDRVRGIPLSKERKEHLSKINSGDNSPRYGIPRSTETKNKVSESLMGHKVNDDTKKKISETLKEYNKTLDRSYTVKAYADFFGISEYRFYKWKKEGII